MVAYQSQPNSTIRLVCFFCKVFFRAGISRTCLEGFSWKEIKIADFNVVQISVGPCGSFWGVTWDGEAVHRKGIDHSNPSGSCLHFAL